MESKAQRAFRTRRPGLIKEAFFALVLSFAFSQQAFASSATNPGPYVFEWAACEQQEVAGAAGGECTIEEGGGEPRFVVFLSPVEVDEALVGLPGFLAAVNRRAGIEFHGLQGGGVGPSFKDAHRERTRFLARMRGMYGARLRVVAVDPSRDPEPRETARSERHDNRPSTHLEFLASAFADLDVSTDTLVSMLRHNLRYAAAMHPMERRAEFEFCHTRAGNYLYRVGKVFPRFNRPMDFAPLIADLGVEGVRAPQHAQPGDLQHHQVAFLRHFLEDEPAAREAMRGYLASLERLDLTLEALATARLEEPSHDALITRLPRDLDDFEQAFAALKPLLQRQFDAENRTVLESAIRHRLAAMRSREANAAAGAGSRWYFLWAACEADIHGSDRAVLCASGREGERSEALAVSSVFEAQDDVSKSRAFFSTRAAERLGPEPEVRMEGPFPDVRTAEAQLVTLVRARRTGSNGQIAVTGIPLQPTRLDDEPNEAEAASGPSPFPPIMAAWPQPDARLVRGDADCGLFTAKGTQVLPQLMHDAWGGDGFSCPFQLHDAAGIYGFHVRRNGAVCGELQVCTELYDAAGDFLGVIDYSPNPVFSPHLFSRFGLIASGTQRQGLYSIPERRTVSLPLPFTGLTRPDRVGVEPPVVVDDRLAVPFKRVQASTGASDEALFFLDAGRFESSWPGAYRLACAAEGPAWASDPKVLEHLSERLHQLDTALARLAAALRRQAPHDTGLKQVRAVQRQLAEVLSSDGTLEGLQRAAAFLAGEPAESVATTLSRRGATARALVAWLAADPDGAGSVARFIEALSHLEARLASGSVVGAPGLADELDSQWHQGLSRHWGRLVHDHPDTPPEERAGERLRAYVEALCPAP